MTYVGYAFLALLVLPAAFIACALALIFGRFALGILFAIALLNLAIVLSAFRAVGLNRAADVLESFGDRVGEVIGRLDRQLARRLGFD